MDIVYPVRSGENEELRYSLRSLANLPHDEIWMYGRPPRWVTGVNIVQRERTQTKNKTTTKHIWRACHNDEISDPFIMMNDDFFIMQSIAEIPVMNLGTVEQVAAERIKRHGMSPYVEGMLQTAELAKQMGILEPYCYEVHAPIVIHKQLMIETIQRGNTIPVLHKRSLYGNLLGERGVTVEDVKIRGVRDSLDTGDFLSSHDSTFGVFVKPHLQTVFPHSSPYEKH